MGREGLEELAHQFGVEGADLLGRELDAEHEKGAARNIERATAQRLVHWRIGMAITDDAAPLSQSLGHRLTKGNRRIFNRVMLVDVQVALDPAPDVDQRMAAELFDHVIEKSDPGRYVILAGAIEIDLDRDVGFVRFPGDSGGAHGLRL